jgi:hypothetical protein
MAPEAIDESRRRANVPSPIGSAAPLIGLAALALALVAAPELPWQVGACVAALFVGAAAVRAGQQWLAVRRLRTLADRIILRADTRMRPSALVSWRVLELTSARHRHAVASEAARLTRELDAGTLPGAVPLNRAAVRPYRTELAAISTLLDGDAPVTARGVLLAHELLSSPSSPLFDRELVDGLRPQLRRVLSALRA